MCYIPVIHARIRYLADANIRSIFKIISENVLYLLNFINAILLNSFKYRSLLTVILIHVVITTVLIAGYHWLFVKQDYIDQDIRRRAIQVAENDILFSDRFSQRLHSAVPSDFIAASEISRKAVVFIKTDANPSSGNVDSPFSVSSGSGVILTTDGYIVTNYHVVRDASQIEITLNDNRVFSARLLGSDPNTDLALLKISAQNLDFLTFANSDTLQIGEWVMAVGNPFRLQSTVTAGIVSAKARNINLLESQGIESFIQTDAAVNPGNSGGALINTHGELVGICTAIESNSGRYEGFSFAIPSNLVRKVVDDLRTYGVVQRGWVGVEVQNITDPLAKDLNLPEVSGVLVASVNKGSGAYEAGILNNDVITHVEKFKTKTTSEFMEQIANYRPGDQIQLTVIRHGKTLVFDIVLRNQLNSTDLIGTLSEGIFKELGLEIREADKYEKAVFASKGVIVVSVQVHSLIGKTRMEPGFIITKVNDIEVTSALYLKQLLESNRGKTVIIDGYYPKFPGDYPYSFTIPE